MDTLSPLLEHIPDIRPGQTVRVHQRLQEGGKERIQIFEGLVLKRSAGNSASATMTVRKISGGIGVERIFPLHSPLIAKIDIIAEARVRRANISYVRKPRGRQLKSHPINKPKA